MNVSEGRDAGLISRIAASAGRSLLDVHSDFRHNRSVLTLGGADVADAARAVAAEAVAVLDLRSHEGVHPRLGVVDVVPFVALPPTSRDSALAARDEFADWAGHELKLPVFKYGPERSLPEIRRSAFASIQPDNGLVAPHPTAGACCAGARGPLVAWNLWLAEATLDQANQIVRELRRRLDNVRALAFDVGGVAQVSCNLIEPLTTGPLEVYDFVVRRAAVERCELVGLVPDQVLRSIPEKRWPQLDLSVEKTLEFRLGS
ncbi:MAG: hypothetical protein KY395_02765 [Actinobacteria bacterium]|nr:hypothetical protein [Actinomycetota bacterium]